MHIILKYNMTAGFLVGILARSWPVQHRHCSKVERRRTKLHIGFTIKHETMLCRF